MSPPWHKTLLKTNSFFVKLLINIKYHERPLAIQSPQCCHLLKRSTPGALQHNQSHSVYAETENQRGGRLDKNNWFDSTLFRTVSFSCKRRADNKWDGVVEGKKKTQMGSSDTLADFQWERKNNISRADTVPPVQFSSKSNNVCIFFPLHWRPFCWTSLMSSRSKYSTR